MYEVVIIGGGVMGMLSARELVRSGLNVAVVEKAGSTGLESSWAGGGILSPLYPWRYPDAVSQLARWSQRVYPELCGQLAEETGIDPEWTQNGLLILNSDEAEQAMAWAERNEVQLESIPEAAIAELQPGLSADAGNGLWLPQVAQVRNPRLLKALRKELPGLGVRFYTDTPVQRLLVQSDAIRGVATDRDDIRADKVVVAAGAWSASLLAGLAATPKVEPVRGQMLLFRAEPGVVQRIVLSRDRYLIPRRDGRVLVGSTPERVGFDKATTESARQELLSAVERIMPSLLDWPIERHWAGLRPGSPDGTPFIYRHPEIEGLFVNTGHYRNGVVLGPASARLLADLVLERETIWDVMAYNALTLSTTI